MSDDATPGTGRGNDHPLTDPTGVLPVDSTQVLPEQAAGQVPGHQHAQAADDTPDWFEAFDSAHPAQGPGVPARADDSWGSDRADAIAEQEHQARYAPPHGAPSTSHPGPAGQLPAAPELSGPGPQSYSQPQAQPQIQPETQQHPQTQPNPQLLAAPSFGNDPQQGQFAYGDPADGGAPVAPAPAKRRRGLVVAGVAAMCLASGVVGGVAGQVIDDRTNIGGSTLPEPGPGATQRPSGSVANIAAKVLPSVVTIRVDAGTDGSGTGSGFVIDAKGHILTNNHVVAGGASSGTIQVVLSNGDSVDAKIVGRDVSYDLAVLKVNRTDLTPLRLGKSDQVVVGDQVIAVGAPLGLDQTVTTGIISALNRPVTPGDGDEASYINAIQTDAAINPGNSGGPLLDMNGEVIGVNSAIARVPGTATASGGNIGLGFAIPSDQARRTADQLIATGKATHPIIGVMLDRTFDGDGAQVQDKPDGVTTGGPAAKAGVKPGDVIVGFEGKPVRSPDQLIVSIRARAVGDTVTLQVDRDGKRMELRMTLEADPGN